MDYKILKHFMTIIFSIFLFDISNFAFTRNLLLNECNTISYLISKECGLSSKLMNYLSNKDYQFFYNEENTNKIGDIVSYYLIKDYQGLFMLNREIKIEQAVILGSYV